MKKWIWLSLLVVMGCGAKETQEVVEGGALTHDSVTLEATADSVSNTRIDGTETSADLPVDLKKQLSQEIQAYLDQKHTGWQLPELSEEDEKRIPAQEQGPYFVQADFDGNGTSDYAIQLVKGDTSSVVVLTQNSDKKGWREHALEKQKLQEVDGEKRSLLVLTLAEKSAKYYDYNQKARLKIPRDGVSVGKENQTAIYVWDNNGFKKYQTRE